MFSEEDYRAYFGELENAFSRNVVLLTDILNEVSDKAIHSRLYAMVQDDMRIFEDIRKQRESFGD